MNDLSDTPDIPGAAADPDSPVPAFTPVAVRAQHGGWTPARQLAFLQSLADTACVSEAAARVGLTPSSAYQLRRRPDAASFRAAWDIALDFSINRLSDALLGRALNGVATPVFYKGEQVGERRRYDERLAMFLLRYRQPERYGAWLDDMSARERHPDGPAIRLAEAFRRVAEDGVADQTGRPRPLRRPLRATMLADDPAEREAAELAEEAGEQARRDADWQRYVDTLGAERDAAPASSRDVVTKV